MKKHKVELRFCVSGFEDITHAELTNLFGIKPVKEYLKGLPINPKLSQGKVATLNRWLICSPNFKVDDDFETQMNGFIELAKNKTAVFNDICKKYFCEFSCAIFLEAGIEMSTPWIHLGDDYNTYFGKLNVHFDMDLYV